MFADIIELGYELDAEDVDKLEVTGFVTDVVSAFEFTVGTQLVRTDADTIFVDGTAGNIALGVKLEAEGSLEGGILFAQEVEFWEPDQIEVEGLVTNVVSAYKFTVGDQDVQTDAETVYEGGTPDDIALGVTLEVKGVPVDISRSILIADKVSFE
jgi:surface antigen